MVDAVSADRLMHTIRALEGFGTRYEFTPQQDSAGAGLSDPVESVDSYSIHCCM